MNLIFMRHGEATDNIKELLSDKEIYWSVLTEKGKKTSKKSIEALSQKIDKISLFFFLYDREYCKNSYIRNSFRTQ